MADHHLVLLQILLLLCATNASNLLSCSYTCGNVSISYPFGIGEDCYFNKWFEVTCDNSYGKPFLTSIDLELSKSSYSSSFFTIEVYIPINSSITNKTIDLSGSPFSLSYKHNRLAVIGCDSYNMINRINDSVSVAGCLSISTCDPTQNGGCYDFLCTIPPNPMLDFQKIRIPRRCKSAFMVDQGWIESNYLDDPHVLKYQEYVPVTLDWDRRRGSCVELFNRFTSCNKDNYCLIPLTSDYYCLCVSPRSDSYQGCAGYLVCNTTNHNNCSICPYGYQLEGAQDTYGYKFGGEELAYCYQTNIKDMNKKSQVKLIIIGCTSGLGILLLLIGAWWLYKFIKSRKAIKLKKKFFKRNGGLLLQQHMSSSEGNIEKSKLFTSKELEKATHNYNANRILGQGGQGTVYKGMLAEGKIVAIKRSKVVDESKLEEFINEVVILSQINHRNVVKLLGCCLETEVPLLVYEFIPNGTLFQHLHDQDVEFPITWELRLHIAIDVAGALSYLHSSASIPIYHRDIKSTNILLDDKYRAKVSDFGTSRSIAVDQTHLTTQVQGTFGYVDPEYFRSSQFTEKSDVYSFGVVLAELLTGQKPIRSTNSEEDKSLVAYFLCSMKEDRLFDILDYRVLKEGKKEDIVAVANLIRRCLNQNGKRRPTMKEVAIELAGIISSEKGTIMQQNCEEIDFVKDDLSTCSETSSSFTESFLVEVNPLILNKWT